MGDAVHRTKGTGCRHQRRLESLEIARVSNLDGGERVGDRTEALVEPIPIAYDDSDLGAPSTRRVTSERPTAPVAPVTT